jgi:hypothetical protein
LHIVGDESLELLLGVDFGRISGNFCVHGVDDTTDGVELDGNDGLCHGIDARSYDIIAVGADDEASMGRELAVDIPVGKCV